MRQVFFIAFALFYCQIIHSQTVTWTGNKSSNWQDKDNWDIGLVPQQGDNVIIAIGSNSCIKDDNDVSEFNHVQVLNGATLTINNNTPLYISGQHIRGLHVLGTLINAGHVAVFDHDGDGIIVAGGTITNHEDLEISNLDAFSTAMGKGIVNEGTITNNNKIDINDTQGSGFEVINTLHNNGEIEISNTIGVSLYSEGTINNNASGLIDIDNNLHDEAIQNTDATFTNNGEIDIHNVTNTGINNSADFINGAGSTISIKNNR